MPIWRREFPVTADPRVKLDKILKPFETYQQRRDQALAALRAPPEEQETRFCWGGPGQFTFDDIPSNTAGTAGFKEEDDKEKEKPKDKQKVLQWNEEGRAWKKIRVENPDDPEQYVIINRIEWIVFKPPGDEFKDWIKWNHKFTLKHPAEKKQK